MRTQFAPNTRARIECINQLEGSPKAPPTVAGIAPNFGAAAGGTAVTISGNHFNGATTVLIGGVPATSVVVVDDHTITAVTPALASGSINNVAVQGVVLSNAWLAFTPADLTLSGWWTSNFATPNWTPSASAGTSGARGNLTQHGGTVVNGTPQNGKIPASFPGTADLINATLSSVLFTVGAGTLIVIMKPGGVPVAPSGNVYDDPAVYEDGGNARVGLTYTTSGFGAFIFDGAVFKSKYVACPTGAYHLVMMRWNGAVLGVTLDSAPDSTVAAGPVVGLTGTMEIMQGYAGGFVTGDVLDLMFAPSAISDANYTKIKNYALFKYNLTL